MYSWAWIPITIGAALAQTLRNAAQRHLTGDLGALGATLVRFFYGLPFAAIWLVVAWFAVAGGRPLPEVNPAFLCWTVVASLSQKAVSTVLVGYSTLEHLEYAARSFEKGPLPQATLDRIAEIQRGFVGETR